MRLGNAAVGLTQQEYAISAEGVAHDHMQNTPEFLGFYPWYDTENKYEGGIESYGSFRFKYIEIRIVRSVRWDDGGLRGFAVRGLCGYLFGFGCGAEFPCQ